jgi:hypothetical protein
MDVAECGSDADGELEESRYFHRFAEMAVEWLATGVLEK